MTIIREENNPKLGDLGELGTTQVETDGVAEYENISYIEYIKYATTNVFLNCQVPQKMYPPYQTVTTTFRQNLSGIRFSVYNIEIILGY